MSPRWAMVSMVTFNRVPGLAHLKGSNSSCQSRERVASTIRLNECNLGFVMTDEFKASSITRSISLVKNSSGWSRRGPATISAVSQVEVRK